MDRSLESSMPRSKVDHNTARSEAVDEQNPKAVDAMLEC
jgi:hypothetical protein